MQIVVKSHIMFLHLKYVGVQSWKAAQLPTLDIRVEQKENLVMKKISEKN